MPSAIPLNFRANESFRKDFLAAVKSPPEFLLYVAEYIDEEGEASEQLVGRIADRFGLPKTDAFKRVAVLSFIRQRVVRGYASSEEANEEFIELTGELTDDSISFDRAFLEKLFSVSDEEKNESANVKALNFGPAFVDVEIRPIFLPDQTSDDTLYSGYIMNLTYVGESGEQKTVSVNFSPSEIASLGSEVEQAEDRMEKLNVLIRKN